jgi:hypothetical protein
LSPTMQNTNNKTNPLTTDDNETLTQDDLRRLIRKEVRHLLKRDLKHVLLEVLQDIRSGNISSDEEDDDTDEDEDKTIVTSNLTPKPRKQEKSKAPTSLTIFKPTRPKHNSPRNHIPSTAIVPYQTFIDHDAADSSNDDLSEDDLSMDDRPSTQLKRVNSPPKQSNPTKRRLRYSSILEVSSIDNVPMEIVDRTETK